MAREPSALVFSFGTPMTPSKKSWTTGDKILLAALAAVPVVLILVFLAVIAQSSRPAPAVVVPSPVLPSPNAYDTLVTARGALVDDASCPVSEASRKSIGFTQADKEAMLSRNVRALALVRRGLRQPFVSPPVRSFLDSRFSRASLGFRGLARLLTLESQVKAGRGNWSGAAESGLDCIALGEKMARGSGLLGMLVGGGCQGMGGKAVAPTLTHLDAKAARAAAKRLEEITAAHVSFADAMTEEKWQTQAGLLELFGRPNWRGTLGEIVRGETFGKGFGLNRRDQARLFLVSDSRILRNYTRWIDWQIAQANRPYAAHPPAPPAPGDPFTEVLAWDRSTPRFREANSRTKNTLLMLTLALRAYQLQHGAYPETLTELLPGILRAVPADPFAASGPLHYQRRGAKYTLYSIGPDGIDDGGRAIDHPGRTTSAHRFVEPDSKGDIVAGVNP